MIKSIKLLRNIGQFDSVTQGSALPFTKLTLIYAENGRGKTTLASILRSLGTGDPIAMSERQRLSATHAPHVIVECIGSPTAAMFQNNSWNRSVTQVAVFDDVFVDQNVCSGLAVASDHRQKLHELILGAQGVALNRELQTHVAGIEEHNRILRTKSESIPAQDRGGFSVDAFCALQIIDDLETQIESAERQLAAALEAQPIRTTGLFEAISLPELNAENVNALLRRDLPNLDANAVSKVQQHMTNLGQSNEMWVSEGFRRLPLVEAGNCPFCAQDLSTSTIIEHYRAYFSLGYSELKRDIADAITAFSRTHAEESPAAFERAVRLCGERRQFWARFCELPEIAIDTAEIARSWRSAREAVLTELKAKQAAPLDLIPLSSITLAAIATYEQHRENISQLSQQLQVANQSVDLVKEQAASGNVTAIESDLVRLKAVRARHSAGTSAKCTEYLEEKSAKAATEGLRDQAKRALSLYRESVFPLYQTAINEYLRRFNANFRLGSVAAADTRGGPTCNYSVVINETPVIVAGATSSPGTPSFRTTLSSGDRNTLALAFFFASLDQDPSLADKIAVIDDPITSLDDHRSLTTVQEIRKLVQRTSQVIILSHSKPFLCRLSEHPDRSIVTAIQVTRDGPGSTLATWNVEQDCITEHDRRHALLREYKVRSRGNERDVAKAIRPMIEAFLRVACPEHFPPSTLLGHFRNICDQRVGTPQQILDGNHTQELRELIEFANRFHHDTNPAWETENINDAELLNYVQRALEFASR